MTRKECLEQAAKCVLQNRQDQYGEPEDSFGTIAMMWSAYLGKTIQGWDVAAMMALLKIARIKANPAHTDNWCDLAGYAACGAECRQRFEAEMKKTVEDAFETFPHLKPEAEGGCFQNGNNQPEFKPGDKVQARLGDGVWRDAEVTGKEITCGKLYYTVKVADFNGYYSLQADDVRPASAPKAEGCEELVQKDLADECGGCLYRLATDAPQTPEETCQRIVDSNPATYSRARKPTGEELAEMAEEDVVHG